MSVDISPVTAEIVVHSQQNLKLEVVSTPPLAPGELQPQGEASGNSWLRQRDGVVEVAAQQPTDMEDGWHFLGENAASPAATAFCRLAFMRPHIIVPELSMTECTNSSLTLANIALQTVRIDRTVDGNGGNLLQRITLTNVRVDNFAAHLIGGSLKARSVDVGRSFKVMSHGAVGLELSGVEERTGRARVKYESKSNCPPLCREASLRT